MHRLVRRSLTAIAAIALAAPLAAAQTPQEVLERYRKAVDPQGKLSTLEGMKSSVTMEAPAMGMTATINIVTARPNLFIAETEIQGLGTIRQGHDGSTVWSSDPMNGPRIVSGMEASTLVENSALSSILRSADQFTALEPAGTFDAAGEATTCVKFTWKSGRESTDCFSNATGLLVRSLSKVVTQMGEAETEVFMKDYRNVGGIMMPHRTESMMMGTQMTMTTTSVEFGPQPAALFQLPAEIKALKP